MNSAEELENIELYKQLIEKLNDENVFLKESLKSVQEVYIEDRQTIKVLINQVKLLQDELEFTKRKYKLMWNKAVENYKK